MPLFHRQIPDDLPPTELTRHVRRQLSVIWVVVVVVLTFLVLVVVATLVATVVLLGRVNATVDQAKQSSQANTRILTILQQVTGPRAQVQQGQVLVHAFGQIDCNLRRALVHLPPTPSGQECVLPPGN